MRTPSALTNPRRPGPAGLLPLLVLAGFLFLVGRALVGGPEPPRVTYSQLIRTVETAPASIREVVFEPRSQSIQVIPVQGRRYRVNYPSAEAQIEFQQELEQKGVAFDSKGTG